MRTGNFETEQSSPIYHQYATATENQSELARERSWEERMAVLETIHEEISPQLEALRAADDDYILNLPVFEIEA